MKSVTQNYESIINNQNNLYPFDANSLYASIMSNKYTEYPDITTFKILSPQQLSELHTELNTIITYYNDNPYRNTIKPLLISPTNKNLNNYIHDTIRNQSEAIEQHTNIKLNYSKYHFILNLDYTITNTCFIPLAQKYSNKSYYTLGKQTNQTLNSIDILELMKITTNNNITIDKIHSCIIFTENIPNILSDFILDLQTNRSLYKNTNQTLSNLYKLLSNSLYGKTITKTIDETYKFTTTTQLRKIYANEYLISHQLLDNNQILVRHKVPSENLYQNKALQKIINRTPQIIGSYILGYSR